MRERQPHWFNENKANRYPRRLICLDSEAERLELNSRAEHSLRLAFATFDQIDKRTMEPKRSEDCAFLDAEELWLWVSSFATRKERLAVFAHNLGYDLRLTDALTILPKLGWEILDFALDSYRCWLRWRREQTTMLMVDTLTFVGSRLADYSDGEHWQRPALPDEDAPFEEWLQRCRTDTYLLRSVVLRLLRFMESEECGNFRMTGAAQASAAFRHKFLKPKSLLIHDNTEALEAERRAAWTGRCEVWRHGEVRGEIQEWDFNLAYARIASTAELPAKLCGELATPTQRTLTTISRSCISLCNVSVVTPAPVVPCAQDGRIVWPIGSFDTTLWDCELDLLREAGAQVEIHRAWYYRRAPLLQEWGQWIIDSLEGEDAQTCAVVSALLKGWSRSLIGRFGLRYSVWEQAGRTPNSDFLYLPFIDGDTKESGAYLRLGKQLLVQEGLAESPDSAPSIMSYIMALARVKLWRAIQAIPREGLIYCDTDSLITSSIASNAVAQFANTCDGTGLRLKRTYDYGRFLAPRQVQLGSQRRMAGIPRKARENADGSFDAEVWESPQASLQRGAPGNVTVFKRRMRAKGRDYRRQHLPDGATAPIEVSV